MIKCLNYEQTVFLKHLAKLHNDGDCTYDNSWSISTAAILKRGTYNQSDKGMLERVTLEYTDWRLKEKLKK